MRGAVYSSPIVLALWDLPDGVKVLNASGTTSRSWVVGYDQFTGPIIMPAGTPYIEFNLGGDGQLRPGELVSFDIQFQTPNIITKPVVYDSYLLNGPNP